MSLFSALWCRSTTWMWMIRPFIINIINLIAVQFEVRIEKMLRKNGNHSKLRLIGQFHDKNTSGLRRLAKQRIKEIHLHFTVSRFRIWIFRVSVRVLSQLCILRVRLRRELLYLLLIVGNIQIYKWCEVIARQQLPTEMLWIVHYTLSVSLPMVWHHRNARMHCGECQKYRKKERDAWARAMDNRTQLCSMDEEKIATSAKPLADTWHFFKIVCWLLLFTLRNVRALCWFRI